VLRPATCGSIFDLARKEQRITEIEQLAAGADFWNDAPTAQNLMREMNVLKQTVDAHKALEQRANDVGILLEFAEEGSDAASFSEAQQELATLEQQLAQAELERMFSGAYDHNDAILTVQPGAGGVDAQDWAEMLYRMYSRWAAAHNFKVSEMDFVPADVAGIKSVTLAIEGDRAYGYLRGERGVHRLVRISPFNAGGTRETSFARVEVYPDIQDNQITIEINPAEIEVDTYRSQGAGGQNVQKNESAIRITHKPTGIIVTCQDQRSQTQNRERAMHILKVRLMEMEMRKREDEIRRLKGEYVDANFGSQIRNYVLHPYQLVKDTRTSHETSQIQSVLNGDLDGFMEAYLKQSH
jgi:peptide chain release factor 2